MNLPKYSLFIIEVIILILIGTSIRYQIPGLWPLAYIIIYRILNRGMKLELYLSSFTTGFLFFSAMYFYGIKRGFYIFFFAALISGISFLLTAIFFRKIQGKNVIRNALLFTLIFATSKFVSFYYFYDFSYTLENPVPFLGIHQYLSHSIIYHTVIFLTLLTYEFYINKKFKLLSIPILSFSILSLANFFILKSPIRGKKEVNIALVQHHELRPFADRIKDPSPSVKIFEQMLNQAITKDVEMIILPEYILNESPTFKIPLEKYIQFSKKHDVVLVFGYNIFNAKERRNNAVVIDPEKGLVGKYSALTQYVDWNAPENIINGNETKVFKTKHGRFFINICFELMDRSVQKRFFKKKDQIDYIISIANNEFFTHSKVMEASIPNQQIIASWFQKPVIASANTGPTIAFDSYGRTLKSLPFNKRDILYLKLRY